MKKLLAAAAVGVVIALSYASPALATPAPNATKIAQCKAAYPTLPESICVSKNGDPNCGDIPGQYKPVKITGGNDPAGLDGSTPKNGWGCEDATHPIPSASASPSPTKSASPSPSVSKSVTPSATSSPTAAVPGGTLPVTGAKTSILVGSGVFLLAAGIAVLIVLRKRDETKFIAE